MHYSIIDTQLRYEVQGPAHLIFNLEAVTCEQQHVLHESLQVEPALALRRYTDAYSANRFVRLDVPPGNFSVRYNAVVQRQSASRPEQLLELPVSRVPDALLPYLLPTRYCESDVMSRAAQQLFGDLAPGLDRVQAIVDWIYESIAYEAGSSVSTTTAQEVFVQRAGVCRDFAHLGVTFCRALNIPARLVVGYVQFTRAPQDFHAIFEAWLGGQWVMFDPTRMAPADRLVRVGTGRDAKDVAFCTFYGPVNMTHMAVSVTEQEEMPPLGVEPQEAPTGPLSQEQALASALAAHALGARAAQPPLSDALASATSPAG